MTEQITISLETWDAMMEIVSSVEGMVNSCDVSSGVCCCGDSMNNHPNPMYCGHSPVDSGVYAADSLLKKARAALTAANAVQKNDSPT